MTSSKASHDALVAATALVIRAPLASGNHADYRFISGLALKPFRV